MMGEVTNPRGFKMMKKTKNPLPIFGIVYLDCDLYAVASFPTKRAAKTWAQTIVSEHVGKDASVQPWSREEIKVSGRSTYMMAENGPREAIATIYSTT